MLLKFKTQNRRESVPFLQPVEELPVYDLIVAGLGTAGVYAALTAAKQGLRVLGIEKLNCCGGTGTAGDVHGYYFGTPGGIYEELDEKVREMESVEYMPVVGLNPEAKKYVCEQALIDSKVEIHYESRVTGVLMEENTVCGIQWIENGEEKTALAKITLDCTGESGICDTIGCRMERGRAFDGQVQPYSVVQPEIVNGLVEFYHYLDCGYMDALDAGQYAKACVDAACLLHYNLEDYRIRRVLGISILLGLREGRRIVGEETVELQDYLEDRMTDHPAFYAYSNLDNHGRDLAFESEGLQDWLVASSLWGINISVPVPLGCCIPKGYEGILAAGRNISIGHDIASCVRQRRDMQKCGEAVGCAAALAIRKGISVREVPYEELKKQLLATGCLKKTDDSGIWDIEEGRWHRTAWLNEAGDIYQGLKSNRPGIAIWSAKRMGKCVEHKLEEWLSDSDRNVARNSALALGILGNRKALPALRCMAEERDPYVPKTSRKYNQLRGLSAVYLLGRLRDGEAVGILEKIMEHPEDNRGQEYQHDSFIRSQKEYGFQFFTHAVMALSRIAAAHPELSGEITGKIQEAMKGPFFESLLSDTSEDAIYISCVARNMRELIK